MSSSINENLKADADILQSDQQSSGGSISGSIGFNDYDNLRKIFGPVAGIEPLGAMQPYSSGEISQTLPNEARVSSSTMITTDSRDNNIQALKTRIAQQQSELLSSQNSTFILQSTLKEERSKLAEAEAEVGRLRRILNKVLTQIDNMEEWAGFGLHSLVDICGRDTSVQPRVYPSRENGQ